MEKNIKSHLRAIGPHGLDLSALETVIDAAQSLLSDKESGVEEGTYDAQENTDLPELQEAIASLETWHTKVSAVSQESYAVAIEMMVERGVFDLEAEALITQHFATKSTPFGIERAREEVRCRIIDEYIDSGWHLYDGQIFKVVEIDVFHTDAEALAFVQAKAGAGSPRHNEAWRIHKAFQSIEEGRANRKVADLTDVELALFCGFEAAEQGAQVRKRCRESNWETTSDIPSGMNLGNMEQASA